MRHDYIRREIPAEISESGGATIALVNRVTVPLKTSIEEAKAGNYVMGDAQLIENTFTGLFRSMSEGVQRDGHPRQIGDFITIYPVMEGAIDLDKGYDPAVNSIRLRARLLNNLTIDTSGWTFRDVTPGLVAFKIESVSDGEVKGRVSTDKSLRINGGEFPDADLLTVSWVCAGQSGTVDHTKLTGDVSRLTIDASALSTLTAAEDGKAIVFTVKGCYNKVTVTAIVKYVAPTPTGPTFTQATSEGETAGTVKNNTVVTITGTNLNQIAGETIVFKMPNEDEGLTSENASNISIAADGKSLTCSLASSATNLVAGTGSVAVQGQAISVNFDFEL